MIVRRVFTMSRGPIVLGVLLLAMPAVAGEEGKTAAPEQVQERAVLQPYTCSADSGVCLCVGQSNCDLLTQPKPCKRPKFCLGQSVAQSPPPLPGQEVPLSSARTITTNLMVCSYRAQ